VISILGWLIKIFNKLGDIYNLLVQGFADQKAAQEKAQADIDTIKIVLGVGIPVQETIIWGQPKP
jgi:hypothetical protein